MKIRILFLTMALLVLVATSEAAIKDGVPASPQNSQKRAATSTKAALKLPANLPVCGGERLDQIGPVRPPEVDRTARPTLDTPIGSIYAAGTTWYDQQHNGSAGRMICVDNAGYVHLVWTNGLNSGNNPRYVYYNVWDPATQQMLIQPGGTQINSSTRAGYICQVVTPGGWAFPAFHEITAQPGVHSAAAIDFWPQTGAFTTFQPDPIYQGGVPLDLIWPKIAIGRDSTLHMVSTYNNTTAGDPEPIAYSRGLPSWVDGYGDHITWQPIGPDGAGFLVVDTVYSISADIACSKVSDRVAIAYAHRRIGGVATQRNNDLYLRLSEDGGMNWGQPDNLTNFSALDSMRLYTDLSLVFDEHDNLHIAFTTDFYMEDGSYSNYRARIWHWDEASGVFSLMASAWNEGTYVPGTWNLNIQRPSLSIDPVTEYLYCSYQNFDQSWWSSAGYPNADAWVTVSTDGGRHWSVGRNVTDTHPTTNPAPVGESQSERDITLADRVTYSGGNGYLHLEWELDRDAGTAIQTTPEGTTTQNTIYYQRVSVNDIPVSPLVPGVPLRTQTLTVLSPNGGEDWSPGSQQLIMWTSLLSETVQIELNRSYPSSSWETITNTANNGNYLWTVTGPTTSTARIRITSVNDPAISDTSDANFSLQCGPTQPPYADQFNGPQLDPCWSWTNEDPSHWNLTARPGWLRIVTQPGSGLDHNFLHRNCPSTSFVAETHLQFSPTANFQQGGLALINGQNGVSFSRIYGYGQLLAVQSGSGACVPQNTQNPNALTDIFLRIEVEDNGVRFKWSADGIQWNDFGVTGNCSWISAPGTVIGTWVDNSSAAAPQIPADFEYFRIDSLAPPPSLTVIAPNGGENWTTGTAHDITWTSQSLPGNVNVELNRAYSGGTWEMLAAAVPNNGTLTWLATEPATNSARIRVSSVSYPTVGDTSDANFTVTGSPATLVEVIGSTTNWNFDQPLTTDCSPGGTGLPDSRRFRIFWDADGNGPDSLDQPWPLSNCNWNQDSLNGNSCLGMPGTYYSGCFHDDWQIPDVPVAPRNRYYLRVFFDDGVTPQYVSSVHTIAPGYQEQFFPRSDWNCRPTTSPALTMLSPNGGENWMVGTTQAITWDSWNIAGTVSIELNRDYPFTAWETVATPSVDDHSFMWYVTPPVSNSARVRITSVSNTLAGDTSNVNFTISGETADIEVVIGSNADWNFDQPLTMNCAPNGLPLPDGRIFRIFWDANANGPDSLDQPWPLSNCYWNEDSMNGNWCLGIPGTYYSGCAQGYWHVTGVPEAPANRYYLKVYLADGVTPQYVSSVHTISAGYQSQAFPLSDWNCHEDTSPVIEVLNPLGGENWMVGTPRGIRWASANITGNVNVEINRQYPTGLWESIAVSAVEDGSYQWTVTPPTTTTARIRIISQSNPSVGDTSNPDFTISPQVAHVALIIGSNPDWNFDQPLTRDCTPGGNPLPDNRVIRIFWDANANGPDSLDQLWPISSCNFNQDSMNGSACLGIPGTYYSGCFHDDWRSWDIPPAPANRFYLRVYFANGIATQYVSSVHTVSPSCQECTQYEFFPLADWTCTPDVSTCEQGNVSGIWHAADSPIRICGDVTVPAGQTLTIEPGVRVEFLGQYQLTVNGTLRAIGTAQDFIYFTCDTSIYSQKWGGIRFWNSTASGSQLAYCEISNVRSTGDFGGGILCDACSPTIEHCRITRNRADTHYGGGLDIRNGSFPDLSDCEISYNSAGWGGGGLVTLSASVHATHCNFLHNSAPSEAGAIDLVQDPASIFRDCVIRNNTLTTSGIPFAIVECSGTPQFDNCIIDSNRAINGIGGFDCDTGTLTLVNCTIANNTSPVVGGIHVRAGLSPQIRNTIISDCAGAGFYFESGNSSAQIRNCAIYGNTTNVVNPQSGPSGLGHLSLQNANGDSCDVYHNIFLDPRFVNGYRLSDSSQCIGAGDTTGAPVTDIEGNLRPNPAGSFPDIGAYESSRGIPAGYDNGRVAYWPLNGNGTDAAGANDLTAANVTYVADRFGAPASAAYFNGTDAYMSREQPTFSFSEDAEFSTSVWARIDSFSYDQYSPCTILWNGTLAADNFVWACVTQVGQLRFAGARQQANWHWAGWGVENLTLGRWVHLVGVYRGHVLRLYVNGVMRTQSDTLREAAGSAIMPFAIGATHISPTSTWGFFKGAIDEVQIYDRALSNIEILDLYGVGVPSITLTYPDSAGIAWPIGDLRTIRWSSTGSVGDVFVELNRNYPSGLWEQIRSDTSNTGSCDWTVTGPASTSARIRIVSAAYPAIGDTSNANFQINGIAAHSINLSLIATAYGQYCSNYYPSKAIDGDTSTFWNTCTYSGELTIALAFSARVDSLRLLNQMLPNGTAHHIISVSEDSATWTTVIDTTGDFYQYQWWTVPTSPNLGNIRFIRVTTPHTVTWLAWPEIQAWGMDTRSVTVTKPNGGENWTIGDTLAIQWASHDLIGNISIELNRGYPSGPWEAITTNTANNGTFEWVVSGPATNFARIRITSLTNPAVGDTSDANFAVSAAHRIVMCENFTNASSIPDATAHPAFWAMLNGLGPDTVAVLTYHVYWPSPYEPMFTWNPLESDARVNFYQVNGVPDAVVDGLQHIHPGYPNQIAAAIRNRRLVSTACSISAPPADASTNSVQFNATVSANEDLTASSFRVYAALISDEVTYASPPGSNGETVFPYVFRDMWPDSAGYPVQLSAGQHLDLAGALNKDASWPASGLHVIVFVQNIATREILHTVIIPVEAVVSPAVEVLSPNGGEVWAIGAPGSIRWTSQNITGGINLELNRSYPTGLWEPIASGLPDTGSIDWMVTGPATNAARIRAFSISNPAIGDTSNGNFAIVSQHPEQDTIAYDDGVPALIYTYSNQWALVRFTATRDLELHRLYFVANNPNGNTSPCSLFVYSSTGGNLGQLLEGVRAPETLLNYNDVAHPNWNEVALTSPLQFTEGQDFFVVVGPAPGGIQSAGWHIILDQGQTENRSSYAMIREGTSWTAAGDWMIRAGGQYSGSLPTLTVTAPNGGENWTVGDSHYITWISQSLSGNVNVELNRAYPGTVWEPIAANISNSGAYLWTISQPVTSAARIRITSLNIPSVGDTSDANFAIQSLCVSGNQSGIWQRITSPITVCGDITVPAGQTLAIEPGVQVEFQGHYKLTVNGNIQAIGTAQDSIFFTCDTLQNTAWWQGLRFAGTADSSRLTYCIVEHGRATVNQYPDYYGAGIYLAPGAKLVVNHSRIRENRNDVGPGAGVMCDHASPIFSDCVFRDNWAQTSGAGLYVWLQSSPLLANCLFEDNSANSEGGAVANQGSPSIQGCTFRGNSCGQNGGGLAYVVEGTGVIANSVIIGNRSNLGGGTYCRGGAHMTIVNCRIDSNVAGWDGGGVYGTSSTLALSNSIIRYNHASSGGGGVYSELSDLTFDSCTVRGNFANGGGGLLIQTQSTGSMAGCTIDSNMVSGERGGGLSVDHSTLTVSSTTVRANSATYGGGVACYVATATFTNCVIRDNWVTDINHLGGGVYVTGGSPEFTQCNIVSNRALNWASAGGVYCEGSSSARFDHCLISGNSSNNGGPGVYVSAASPVLNNCTITNNIVTNDGAQMYITNASPVISNCLIANGNSYGAFFQQSVQAQFRYCDVFGNATGPFLLSSGYPAGLGQLVTVNHNGSPCDVYYNILLDPLFANASGGDYHLTSASPCIDAGDPSSAHDPDSTIADMGAYYFAHGAPQITVVRPNGGETFTVGVPDTIRWTSRGLFGNVAVKLNRDYPNGAWETLYASESNNGAEAWTPTGSPSSHCRIRVESVITPSVFDESNADFAIRGTTVCGNVSGNWTLAGSPYLVTCDLAVLSGQTLTIQPGVVVQFMGGYSLTVNGSIQAVGTATDSIFFTSDPQSNPSGWRGLRFAINGPQSALEYCVVQNVLQSVADAGAVYCNGVSPRFSHCSIRHNSASPSGTRGGGVYLTGGSSATFDACAFSNNYAWRGGGVYIELAGSPSFTGCVFSANSSGEGGAVYGSSSSVAFQRCVFTRDSSASPGGAFYWGGAGSVAVSQCTFVGNYAPTGGAAIHGFQSSIAVNSCIVAYSAGAGIVTDQGGQVRYCDIFGNSGGDSINGAGNTYLDPRFVNYVAGDYHLQITSPCIDAGDPALPHDADSTIADMGAYYFQHTGPNITIVLPNGGESLVVGDVDTVRWTTAWLHDGVRIDLNRNYPSGLWETLLSDTTQGRTFYPWTVTSPMTQSARVRITALSNPTIGDTSNANFSIGRRSLTLSAPGAGAVVIINEAYSVQWTAINISENVKVELNRSYPNGPWEVLTQTAPGNGPWSWPVTGPTTDHARLRISGVTHPAITDTSGADFSISTRNVTLSSPNGGESWTVCDRHNIVWTYQNLPGNIALDINRTYPAGSWETIASSVPNVGTYLWRVSGPVSTQARVRIRSVTYPSIADTSDNGFTILPAPLSDYPGLVSHPFPADSALHVSPTPFLSWFPADSAETYDVYVWPDSTAQPTTAIASNRPDTYYQSTASLAYGGHYRWRIIARNLCGETSGPVWSFVVRALPDLVPQGIQMPPVVYTEHTYQVNWFVRNIGSGNTVEPVWSDAVYLSSSPIFGAQAIRLGQFDNVSALAVGESYANSATFTVPRGTMPGRYYVFVLTDQAGQVLESNETNNLAGATDSMQIMLTPPPDLAVTHILSPNHGFSGNTASVTWTVANLGTGSTQVSNWSDAIYLSSDTIPGGNDVWLGTFAHSGILRPESTYTAVAAVTIPNALYGDYYFIVRTDVNHQVYEFLSDSNNVKRSDSISITLTPPPDLIVADIMAPLSATCGDSIDVTWTVRNQGAGAPFETGWNDRVYLSNHAMYDPAFCSSLGTFHRSGTLAPAGTYQRQETVVLPVGISGPYFIFVKTDCDSQVFEFHSDTNNVSRCVSPIQVELVPWADLIPDSVVAPQSAASGDSIHVRWTVSNRGSAATPVSQWRDKLFLTSDSAFNPASAVLLGSYIHNGVLWQGSHYNMDVWTTLPDSLAGSFYVFVFTDDDNQVYEYQSDGNNKLHSDSAITVSMTPWPDLAVHNVSIPDSALSGQRVDVGWTVQNQGIGVTRHNSWTDRVYLFNRPTLIPDSAYLLATLPHSGSLTSGGEYTAQDSVTLPNRIFGRYYLFVVADGNGEVYEHHNIANNTSRADSSLWVVHAPWPDLVVSSIVPPQSAVSGQHVTVEWTVRNQGGSPTAEAIWTDRVYVSTQPSFDSTTAVLQSSPAHSGVLDVGAGYTRQTDVVMPNGYSGTCFVYVFTDWGNRVYEFVSDTNNLAQSAPIPVSLAPWPDLQVNTAQITGTARAGDSLSVSFTVGNHGQVTTDVSSWTDNIYLLASDVWNPGAATLLRTISHTGILARDSSYVVNARVYLPPQISGAYYVHIKTDAANTVYEYTDESNNVTHTAGFVIDSYPPVDLAVVSINAPDSAWSGQTLNLQWTVQNVGQARTLVSNWQDALYLSQDTLLNPASDILLATYNRSSALDPGQNYVHQQSVVLTNGLSGDYYLLVKTDVGGQITDNNPANNLFVRLPVTHIMLTPPPDLQVTSLDVPSEVNAGQPLHVAWVVRNTGTGATAGNSWNDGVFLSLNAQLDGSDTRLATFTRSGALAVGDSYSVSLDVQIPAYVSGTYYLLVKTDTRDDIYEHLGEDNNVRSSTLGIQTPLMADLAVSAISIPDSAAPGDAVIVSWTLTNISQNAAVGWIRDAVYFSSDTEWAVTDPMLGLADRYIDIPAGGTLVLSKHVTPARTYRFREGSGQRQHALDDGENGNIVDEMPGLPLGSYYAIVRTDIRNSLPETNENNNSGYSAAQIHIVVPSLPLDSTAYNTVAVNQVRYYRIDAEAGLDLRISLTSSLSGAINELYVAHDRVPTLSDFDQCGIVPFMANQQVFVPFTQASPYYVMTIARTLPSGHTTEPITLLAQALHFSALSVTPSHGGTDGSVTCHLQGAGFDSSLHISLVSPDTALAGLVLAMPNRMEAMVNFDLRHVPEGIYDLVLSRTDRSQYVMPSAFTAGPLTGSLELAIQGPSQMRTNRDYQYGFYAYNGANVDLTNARILAEIPAGVEYRLSDTSEYITSPSDAVVEAMIMQAVPGSTQSLALSLRSADPLGMSTITAAIIQPEARIGFESAYLGHLLSLPTDSGHAITLPPSDSVGYDSSLLWKWASAGAGYFEYFRTADVNDIPIGDAWGMRLDRDSIAIFCGLMPHDINGALHPGTGRIQIFPMTDLMAGPVVLWDGRMMHFEHRFSARPESKAGMPAFADRVKQNRLLRQNQQFSLCDHQEMDSVTHICPICNNLSSSSMDNAMWMAYHNAPAPPPGGSIESVMEHWMHMDQLYIGDRMDLLGQYDLGAIGGGLSESLRRRIRDGRTLRIRLVASQDPDAITGPLGYGEAGWIAVEDPCDYTVHYENQVSRATAPAQRVQITVPMNSNVNMNSFRLGSFGFANMTFAVPDNHAYYAQRLDLRDSLGVYVDVTSGVDINAHQAFWIFESIDPLTGEPPTDPQVGLLPVNDSLSHRGEGFCSYTILPRADANSADVLPAQAHIVFDVNDPLDTAPISNTLDAGAPVSLVDTAIALLDSATFVVRWSGHDDPNGSGIASYDLYASYNGGPFELFSGQLTDTVLVFSGDLYNTYGFFTLAHDNVGHVEAMKTQPEGQITLTLGAPARAVDDLTIMPQRQQSDVVARLHWSPVTEDTTGRTITIAEYRIYSRAGVLDHNGVWRQIGAVQDTSYSCIIPPSQEALNVRLFQVIAVAETQARAVSIDPNWRMLPIHRLRSSSSIHRPAMRNNVPATLKQTATPAPPYSAKERTRASAK